MSNSRHKIYYYKNRDKCIAKTRSYYLKNREEILRKQKIQKANNSDKIKKRRLEYREKNREKLRIKQREYVAKNRDSVLLSQRKSYKKHRENRIKEARESRLLNPDKSKQSLKKYYRKNREKILAHAKMMSRLYPEKRREKERNYFNKNRAKVYEKIMRRKIRKMHLIHPDSSIGAIIEKHSDAELMSASSGEVHSVDHIIPLSYNGWHHQDNLQVITRSMNCQKSDNPFWLSPHPGIKDWRDVPRHLWPVDLVPKYLALIEKHKGETIRWDTAA